MAEERIGNTGNGGTMKDDTLYRLNELSDYRVADHSVDIRGMQVKSRDGRIIGTITDLVVDKVAEKVRYFDMELEDDFMADSDHTNIHLLVPIGAARLDDQDTFVYIDRIVTHDEMQHYPRPSSQLITREYEEAVVNYYNRPTLYTGTGEEYTPDTSAGYITTGSTSGHVPGSEDDPIIAYDSKDDSAFYNQDCFKEGNLYHNRGL